MYGKEKGISPMIAAVVLIAFVIAIASIAGPWFQEFLRERASEVEEGAEGQVQCIYASFDFGLEDVEYSSNLSSDIVNVTVDNGREELYNFTVSYVIDGRGYESDVIQNQPTKSDPLGPGSRVVLVTDIQNSTSLTGKDLERVRISTLACPSIERSCNFVTEECS